MTTQNIDYTDITYEQLGRVARISLNRPRYRNALSRPMQEELDAAFARAVADDSVATILLAAHGPHFCSGHDLGTPEMRADLAARPLAEPKIRGEFQFATDNVLDAALRWRELPKPTIAQVHGLCIYGGWKLASAMDIVVAAEDARFLAGPPQWLTLPYDIGSRRAKAVLLDEHVIDAAEARELGIVYKVFGRDELAERALELATRIASRPPVVLQLAKAAVNQAEEAQGLRASARAAIAYRALYLASGELVDSADGAPRTISTVAAAMAANEVDTTGTRSTPTPGDGGAP